MKAEWRFCVKDYQRTKKRKIGIAREDFTRSRPFRVWRNGQRRGGFNLKLGISYFNDGDKGRNAREWLGGMERLAYEVRGYGRERGLCRSDGAENQRQRRYYKYVAPDGGMALT